MSGSHGNEVPLLAGKHEGAGEIAGRKNSFSPRETAAAQSTSDDPTRQFNFMSEESKARRKTNEHAEKLARRKRSKASGRQPARDPKYLDWVRTLACLLCRTMCGVEAAHSGPHGIGQKASDFSALPLCGECHRTGKLSYHNLGPKFFALHGLLSRAELVMAYNMAYLEEAS